MQKTLLSALLLAALCACNKDEEQPTPPENNTTTLEVQVYNALNWSTSQPYGTPEPVATVQLFKTRERFNSNAPAYSQTTDANGKATFAKIDTGLYYIVAFNVMASNLLDATLRDGVKIGYLADSLYQTQVEVAAGPVNKYGAPGNFRLADVNGDGVINANDKTLLPAQSVTVTANTTSTKRILIGKLENRPDPNFANEAAVNEALQSSLASLSKWHELQVTIDAVYTDDYDCTGLGAEWCTINGYTGMDASNATVAQFWKDGFQLISQLNRIITYTSKVQDPNMDAAKKKLAIDRASTLKGYVYLQLNTYFGAVPLVDSIYMPANATNHITGNDTWSYISKLIKTNLPLTTDPVISGFAAYTLAAKLDMLYGLYNNAAVSCAIVSSQGSKPYQLEEDTTTIFTLANNKEIIWSTSANLQASPLQTLFKRGQFLPELRFSEVLFMHAECLVEKNDLNYAISVYNRLRQREQLSPIVFSSDPAFRDNLKQEIRTHFKRHMRLEGVRLPALKRWNMLKPVLTPLGFKEERNELLPIPQEILAQYPNIQQNLGY